MRRERVDTAAAKPKAPHEPLHVAVDRWLRFEHPFVPIVEDAARAVLAGERRVAVQQDFDAKQGQYLECRWTVSTACADTPDAEVVQQAITAPDKKPVGVRITHALVDALPAPVKPSDNTRAVNLAKVIGAVNRLNRAERDAVLPAIEQLIQDGLEARLGFMLRPVAILRAADLDAHRLYLALLRCRAALDGQLAADGRPWLPRPYAACEGCTTVFRPSTEATRHCELCKKRTPPMPLGLAPLPAEVMVPKFYGSHGRMIRAWGRTTAAVCSSCGNPFFGRRDAQTCPGCTGSARVARHRAARADAA